MTKAEDHGDGCQLRATIIVIFLELPKKYRGIESTLGWIRKVGPEQINFHI